LRLNSEIKEDFEDLWTLVRLGTLQLLHT
jgi:hypothetical protein